MTASKSICSLSLDLDNLWSYLKTHGDHGWESFPSFLGVVVPRFLEILEDFGWKITVFVVGQDAALEKNEEALQPIATAGHEIGNHSFGHEPWLHLYSKQQIDGEIDLAEESIEAATGQRPQGFRGPGYSISSDVLRVLANRGYLYDASTLPTILGPLARAYYFFNSQLSHNEKTQRKKIFGGFRQGLQSVKPYQWDLGENTLLEVPVTTMPYFRLPIHFSYLIYLSTFSSRLACLYFKSALTICRIANIEPSLLLHPLDCLGIDDIGTLTFFPGMKLGRAQKSDTLRQLLTILDNRFTILSVGDHAKRIESSRALRVISPQRIDTIP